MKRKKRQIKKLLKKAVWYYPIAGYWQTKAGQIVTHMELEEIGYKVINYAPSAIYGSTGR